MEEDRIKTSPKEKQNRFLDILKGVSKTSDPKFVNFTMKDVNGSLVSQIGKFFVESKYLPVCVEKLSVRTLENTLAYLGESNVINILHNQSFLSCKLIAEIKDFLLLQMDALYIFVQHENYSVVYVFDENRIRLRELKKMPFTVIDVLDIKKSSCFYCCIAENDIINIYKINKEDFVARTLISSYPKNPIDTKPVRRLYLHKDDVYFYQNNLLTNIHSSKITYPGNEIYYFSGTTVILRKEGNKSFVVLSTKVQPEQTYEYNCFLRGKVVNNFLVLHNPSRIMFFEVLFNKLKLCKEIRHSTPEFVIRSNELLINKDLIIVMFLVKGTQVPKLTYKQDLGISCETKSENLNPFIYKPFEDKNTKSNLSFYNSSMDDLLFKLNILPPEKEEVHIMDDDNMTDTSEHTEKSPLTSPQDVISIDTEKSPLTSPQDVISIDTVSHILQNISTKIDFLWKKIEDERIKNEQDSKLKFKRLLDSISQHLNEKLISTIESTVKNEAKSTNMQMKKFITEHFGLVETSNEENLKKLVEKMETCTIAETNPDSSAYLNAFKDVLASKIIPVVESCFEEMRLQMIDELRTSNRFSNTVMDSQTITIKDEIINLIQSDNISNAAMLAMDCDDETFVIFVEYVTSTHLEGIDFSMQKSLLCKAIHLYSESNLENLIGFICNILMCLDLHAMTASELTELYEILGEMEHIDWRNNDNVNLIVSLQKKQTTKMLKKKTLK